MIPEDYIVFSIAGQLKYSKSRTYREQALGIFTTLCRFLQGNNLFKKRLVEDGQTVPEDLVVLRKDFTDEGFDFYRGTVQRWLGALERGTSANNISILERGLKKTRS